MEPAYGILEYFGHLTKLVRYQWWSMVVVSEREKVKCLGVTL
jgi:hypothetical protein